MSIVSTIKFGEVRTLFRDNCSVGQKVMLVTDYHGIGKNNPFVDSSFFCLGTISRITSGCYPFEVYWDNGSQNSYRRYDLALAIGCTVEENRYISIW